MPARTIDQRRENVRRSKAKRKRLDADRKAAVSALMRDAFRKAFAPREPSADLQEPELETTDEGEAAEKSRLHR